MLTSELCFHFVVYLLSNEAVPVSPVNLPEDSCTLTHTDIYRQLGPEKSVCLRASVYACVYVLSAAVRSTFSSVQK